MPTTTKIFFLKKSMLLLGFLPAIIVSFDESPNYVYKTISKMPTFAHLHCTKAELSIELYPIYAFSYIQGWREQPRKFTKIQENMEMHFPVELLFEFSYLNKRL